MPRAGRGNGRSAVGEIQGDFEANAHVGEGGFSPHGAVLLLLNRGIPAVPLSPRRADGQMVLWEQSAQALVGHAGPYPWTIATLSVVSAGRLPLSASPCAGRALAGQSALYPRSRGRALPTCSWPAAPPPGRFRIRPRLARPRPAPADGSSPP